MDERPIESLSDDDLARVALVYREQGKVKVESLDRMHLLSKVRGVNSLEGVVYGFPPCFGDPDKFDPQDPTCTKECDFCRECSQTVPAHRDASIEADLVQLRGPSTPAPKAKPASPPPTEAAPLPPLPPAETPTSRMVEAVKAGVLGEEPGKSSSPSPASSATSTGFSASRSKSAKKSKAPIEPPSADLPKEEARPAQTAPKPTTPQPTKPEPGFVYSDRDLRGGLRRSIQIVAVDLKAERVQAINVVTKRPTLLSFSTLGRLFVFAEKAPMPSSNGASHSSGESAGSDSPPIGVSPPKKPKHIKLPLAEPKHERKYRTKPERRAAESARQKAREEKTRRKRTTTRSPVAVDAVYLDPSRAGKKERYSLRPDGTRWFRLPQGSATELATLPVGTRLERLWEGHVYGVLKLSDGPISQFADGKRRKRDGVWRLEWKQAVNPDGSKAPPERFEHPVEGTLGVLTRHITGRRSWSAARFFGVLPEILDRHSDAFDPVKYLKKNKVA